MDFKKLKQQFIDRDDEDEEYEDEEEEMQAPANPAAAVPTRSAAVRSAARPSQAKPYTMIVINPGGYKDAEKIADHIKSGRPVVMNIEKTEQDTAERIVDFVQGVVYALDGRIEKVSDSIYLCAPHNMSVSWENFAGYGAAPEMPEGPQWDFPRS